MINTTSESLKAKEVWFSFYEELKFQSMKKSLIALRPGSTVFSILSVNLWYGKCSKITNT